MNAEAALAEVDAGLRWVVGDCADALRMAGDLPGTLELAGAVKTITRRMGPRLCKLADEVEVRELAWRARKAWPTAPAP